MILIVSLTLNPARHLVQALEELGQYVEVKTKSLSLVGTPSSFVSW